MISTKSRSIQYIPHYNGLQPGDILLFRVSRETYFSQHLIMFFQSLLHHAHGHYDTTHVAVCVKAQGENSASPIIAHVTEKESIRGYCRETLQEMLDAEGGDRSFLVFRPQDRSAAQRLATIVGDESSNHNIKWTYSAAIASFLQLPDCWNVPDTISNSSICSKFAIEAAHKAGIAIESDGYCLPKKLEKILYNDQTRFQTLCYAGKSPYQSLCIEIEKQLQRIGLKNDIASQKKFKSTHSLYQKITGLLARTPCVNEFEKCIALVKAVLPALQITTGLGIFSATSYSAVASMARNFGIFQRDIDQFEFRQLLPRCGANSAS